MKIRADKVESEPSHLLHARDIRRVFELVPRDWVRNVKEVHLSNCMATHFSRAHLRRSSGELTIHCRRGTLEGAFRALLSELAADSLDIKSPLGRRRSKADSARIAPMIEPLVDLLLAELTPARKNLVSTPNPGFHEVRLNNGNAERARNLPDKAKTH